MRGNWERMEWRRGELCWVTLEATPCSKNNTASTGCGGAREGGNEGGREGEGGREERGSEEVREGGRGSE